MILYDPPDRPGYKNLSATEAGNFFRIYFTFTQCQIRLLKQELSNKTSLRDKEAEMKLIKHELVRYMISLFMRSHDAALSKYNVQMKTLYVS